MDALSTPVAIAALVPMAGRVFGTLLGIAVVLLAGYANYQHRALLHRASADESHPLTRNAPWRTPTAILMMLCGVLIVVGVWIDGNPIAFLFVWIAILTLVMFFFVMAGFDLWMVRRRALEERIRLVRENRDALESDLRDHHRGRPHQGNGTPLR